ncbi:MAG: transcriptional regulator [Anaerotruncus sp.]|nr:transcriptional regulator [Anaerotruncus sp.]
MTRSMIKQYSQLVEFLSRALGPDYEITLCDLSDKNNSIVAIANGQISGRSIGAPLTNVALKLIAEKSYEQEDYRINYSGISVGNRVLRSSTMFIKDDAGKLVGLLCINFDDSRYQELSTKLFQLCHPDAFVSKNRSYEAVEQTAAPDEERESFHNSISAVTEDVLSQVLAKNSAPVDRLTQEEKMKIVGALEQRGVFMLKGAVHYIAQRLCCSQASIYRYLSKISKNQQDPQNKNSG